MDDLVTRIAGRSELFRGLDGAETSRVADAGRRVRLADGQVLLHQGDVVDALVLVLEGSLRLSQVTNDGDEVIVRMIPAGDIIAGVVLLPEERRIPVIASADGKVEILRWPKAVALRLAEEIPRFRNNVFGVIADRMRGSLKRAQDLSTKPVDVRVARALVDLAKGHGRRIDTGILIDRPLGRQELADLVGASMYTVSRLLARWQREGLVSLGRRVVVVRSVPKLEAILSRGD